MAIQNRTNLNNGNFETKRKKHDNSEKDKPEKGQFWKGTI